MIKNHLSRILGERRWTRAKLARLTGIRPSTIGDLYNEMADRVSFDQLDRICEVLDCSISDLLEYIPNQQRRTGKDLILEEHGNRKKKTALNLSKETALKRLLKTLLSAVSFLQIV